MRTAAMLAVALAAATLVSSAFAAEAGEATRASYREAVEPICRADTQANERILAGVKAEVRAGKLKPAAARFTRAARALKSAVVELRAVPQPSADTARLTRWLGKVATEAGFFEAVATKLRRGDKAGAERLVVKLTSEAAAANNLVIPFQFTYCRLDPTRFT